MWKRMTHIYGNRWASSFGSVEDGGKLSSVAATWAKALDDITPQQLADGLNACLRSGNPWPPSLPEFRAMCLGAGVNSFGLDHVPEYYRSAPITAKSRLLSSDERDKRRKDGLDKIRELRRSLGGGKDRA